MVVLCSQQFTGVLEFPIETTGEVSVAYMLSLTSTVSLHTDFLKLYISTSMNIHIGIFVLILLQIYYSLALVRAS